MSKFPCHRKSLDAFKVVVPGIIRQIQDIWDLALLDKFFKRKLGKDNVERRKRVYHSEVVMFREHFNFIKAS